MSSPASKEEQIMNTNTASNIISLEKVKENTFQVSPDELIGKIITKNDFAVISGKIEPTRDLALKLFTATKIESYAVELVQVVNTERETVYVCKATVSRQGKIAEGLGGCSTSEIDRRGGGARQHHDALATAETRAYKRALEAVVGLPFINEIILKLFGGYEEIKNPISAEELIKKIREAKAIPHLRNIWTKYRENLQSYTPNEKERVIEEKENKKRELEGRD